MSTHPDWNRVSRGQLCPICQKPDWCSVAVDGSAALCQRVESEKRVGDAGWLHRLSDNQHRPAQARRVMLEDEHRSDFGGLADDYKSKVDLVRLEELASSLGLEVGSLNRLDVGWDGEAWTFPMRNAGADVVGIRRRLPDGRKLSVKGGHEGLFIPVHLPESGDLIIAEGPTDAAALLDMGFDSVVGRPSCCGGTRYLIDLVKLRGSQEVVVVADRDGPGRRGADSLASVLIAYVRRVRVIEPPAGVNDVRAWLTSGGTRQDVEHAVKAAPVREIHVETRMVSVYG